MILPDLLFMNLKVVFCGMAVSTVSKERGAYYAGPGNKFWNVLFRIGLTPRQLEPEKYRELSYYGIGLTDMVKDQWGMDSQIQKSHFDRESLKEKIIKYKPEILCFNGKRAAQAYYGLTTAKQINYGTQPFGIGDAVVFVLPSTSAAARRWWNEEYWAEVAAYIKKYHVDRKDHL